MGGYIKLYRDLQDNPLWQERPFSKGQAWVDIIFRCNHRCVRMGPQYQNVLVKRGEFINSNVKLSQDWGWSERKVRRFMEYLNTNGFIVYQSMTRFCRYTVLKYAEYQALDTVGFEAAICRTNAEQTPSRRRADAEQTPTNNNDNNDNNDNNEKNEKKYIKDIGILISDFTQNEELKTALHDFMKMRVKIKKPMTERAMKNLLSKLSKMSADTQIQIAILDQSINRSWSDIWPLKQNDNLIVRQKPNDGGLDVLKELYDEEARKQHEQNGND